MFLVPSLPSKAMKLKRQEELLKASEAQAGQVELFWTWEVEAPCDPNPFFWPKKCFQNIFGGPGQNQILGREWWTTTGTLWATRGTVVPTDSQQPGQLVKKLWPSAEFAPQICCRCCCWWLFVLLDPFQSLFRSARRTSEANWKWPSPRTISNFKRPLASWPKWNATANRSANACEPKWNRMEFWRPFCSKEQPTSFVVSTKLGFCVCSLNNLGFGKSTEWDQKRNWPFRWTKVWLLSFQEREEQKSKLAQARWSWWLIPNWFNFMSFQSAPKFSLPWSIPKMLSQAEELGQQVTALQLEIDELRKQLLQATTFRGHGWIDQR